MDGFIMLINIALILLFMSPFYAILASLHTATIVLGKAYEIIPGIRLVTA